MSSRAACDQRVAPVRCPHFALTFAFVGAVRDRTGRSGLADAVVSRRTVPLVAQQQGQGLAEAIAAVARALQAETSTQDTLQKTVELAVATIAGCDHAGITLLADGKVSTPAASSEVPGLVDEIQYEVDQGPCLDAIRAESVFSTDDLTLEARWPAFSARAVAETGVRSMLSFRLFLERDTLGALNLYSTAPAAFGPESRSVGEVFAAHAALALQAALEQDRIEGMTAQLSASRRQTQRYSRQAELAVELQRSMLTELPDLAPLQLAARYLPATEAAEIGGDWYDAFLRPDGSVKLTVGDLAGHDVGAAGAMGQARSVLRALAVDRPEPPGQLLDRFDTVLTHLLPGRTGTCICAQLREDEGEDGAGWHALLASAGHPPPLLLTEQAVRFVELPTELLLGTGLGQQRATTSVALPPGSTLLLYTDGLVERRDRHLDDGLAALRAAATGLRATGIEELCDQLIADLVPHPSDDVCLLAVRIPGA